MDERGDILRNNTRAEEFYGVAPGALIGRNLGRDLEVQPAAPGAPGTTAVRPADGLSQAVHRTAGGGRTTVEVSARLADVEDGQPVTVALVRDIEARVTAERRLLRVNQQLRAAAAIGAVIMREEDEARLVDQALAIAVSSGTVVVAAVASRGAEGPEWSACRAREGGHWACSDLPLDLVEEAFATGRDAIRQDHSALGAAEWERGCALMGLQASGAMPIVVAGRVWGVVQVFTNEPHVFDSETVTLLTGILRDVGMALESIAERRARRELEATLNALFETGPVGIAVLDHENRLVDANAEFLRILRLDRTALGDRALHWDGFYGCVAVGGGLMPCEGRTPFETDFRRADGTAVGVLVGRVPVGSSGERSLAAVIDLTSQRETAESLRQTQMQLLQSQKMETIGRLAGGVAHDFNNLLTVIQGYTQILQAGKDRNAADSAALEQIGRAAERAAALTRQMLAFSRQQVLELRVLDLGRVLTDTEKMIRRLIGEDVEIVMRLHGNLGSVKADPVQIEQVLLNLVVNARDAMPEGGRLTLELENFDATPSFCARQPEVAPGAYVLLSVSDNGEGIEPSVIPRIFEPFFTTKETGKGTGLGLATVYGIVRQSGGHVWVESRPGEGAMFRILLPRVSSRVDDEMVRPITVAMLQRLGYQVHSAPGGEEALAFLSTHPGRIDLLLSDVVMRGTSGPVFAAIFREQRPGVPVLFVSGYTHDAGTLALLTADGLPYLAKPFDMESLGAAVRRALVSQGART